MKLGIVITNKDRAAPLSACLASLAAQSVHVQWVVISDLGSSKVGSRKLQSLAEEFSVSYLRIEHRGWNKGLAFNTALKQMAPCSHVMQLDADMLLHPKLLETLKNDLRTRDCVVHVPRDIEPRQIGRLRYDGHAGSFSRLLSKSSPRGPYCVGGCATFPYQWLMDTGGIDEEFVGWGNQDMEIWGRAQRMLRTRKDMSGLWALHQIHTEVKKSTEQSDRNLRRRKEHDRAAVNRVNPEGFGEGKVEVLVVRGAPRKIAAVPVRTRRRRYGT